MLPGPYNQGVIPPLEEWLASFALAPFLHTHVAVVVTALPPEVLHDFRSDPAFSFCDYEPSHLPAHCDGFARVSKMPDALGVDPHLPLL